MSRFFNNHSNDMSSGQGMQNNNQTNYNNVMQYNTPNYNNSETYVADSMQMENYNNALQQMNNQNMQMPQQQQYNPNVNLQMPTGGVGMYGNYQNPNQATIAPQGVYVQNNGQVTQPEELSDEVLTDSLDENVESLIDTVTEELDEKEVELDPLNNANNPVPVNPVAPKDNVIPEEELPTNVKANIFAVIGLMFSMLVKPGTTIVKNAKKYRSMFKAGSVSLWITIISLALCVLARVVCGCFSKSYNSISGATNINLDMTMLFDPSNYLPYLLITLIFSLGLIVILSLVYYASSFLNSKGIHMGTYFMVSSLGLVPLIIGVTVLYPIISILSTYIALFALIFSFLYTLIAILTGMNEILVFRNNDKKIAYNVLNISCVILIMVFIFRLLGSFHIIDIALFIGL